MTILGSHTVAELRDLMNSYDYQQTELEKAVAGARDHWMAQDPAGYAKWQADYDAWKASYQPAHDAANTELAAIPTSLQSVTTQESVYANLAAAFLPMGDLDRRMRQGPAAAAAPTYANNPQPVAPDADLGAYKAADTTLKALPLPAKPMPLWQKLAYATGAAVLLGIVVKVAK